MKPHTVGVVSGVSGTVLALAGLGVAFWDLSKPGYNARMDQTLIIASAILPGCGLIALSVATRH